MYGASGRRPVRLLMTASPQFVTVACIAPAGCVGEARHRAAAASGLIFTRGRPRNDIMLQ